MAKFENYFNLTPVENKEVYQKEKGPLRQFPEETKKNEVQNDLNVRSFISGIGKGQSIVDAYQFAIDKPKEPDERVINSRNSLAGIADLAMLFGDVVAANRGGIVNNRKSLTGIAGEVNGKLNDVYKRENSNYNQGLLSAKLKDILSAQKASSQYYNNQVKKEIEQSKSESNLRKLKQDYDVALMKETGNTERAKQRNETSKAIAKLRSRAVGNTEHARSKSSNRDDSNKEYVFSSPNGDFMLPKNTVNDSFFGAVSDILLEDSILMQDFKNMSMAFGEDNLAKTKAFVYRNWFKNPKAKQFVLNRAIGSGYQEPVPMNSESNDLPNYFVNATSSPSESKWDKYKR